MKGMNQAQLDTQCTSERENIRRILNSNEMTMTTLVKDRVAVLHALNKIQGGTIPVYTERVEVDELPKFRE